MHRKQLRYNEKENLEKSHITKERHETHENLGPISTMRFRALK